MSAGRAGALRRAAAISARALSAAEPSTSGRTAALYDAVWGSSSQHHRTHRAWRAADQLGRLDGAGAGCRAASSLEALASEPRQATYQIEVITGDVRGAGSPAPAAITLYGEDGESESHVIGAEEASAGFERATRKSYVIYSKDLGQLRRVHIQQLAPSEAATPEDSSEPAMGWYLDRIEVRGGEGERWTFPCGAWLGRPTAGAAPEGRDGCVERNLIAADHYRDVHASSLHDASPRRLTRPLRVAAAGFSMPHPEKVAAGAKGANRKGFGSGGEDAYFYAANRNGVFAAGVADGVYAWKDAGIDSGAFSRRLMEFCRQAVELGTTDVLRALQFADRHLRREAVQGSATACLALVDTLAGRLAAANLGDSGLMLLGFRPDARGLGGKSSSSARGRLAVRYRSPAQEHAFGRPYQLGHHAGADAPEDAMLATQPVYPGDVLVVGSDGLWDNVEDEEVVSTVEAVLLEGGPPSAVAQALAAKAFDASLDKRRVTPYSRAASAAFDMVYNGGKADDITVLALVLE